MILGCCRKTLIIRNNIIVKKSETLFFEVFWVFFGFCLGPLGSWVGDPPPRAENGVG